MLHRTDTAEGRDTHCHRHVDIAMGAHPVLGHLADHLVERGSRESVELDLRYRDEPAHRHPDRNADDGGLGQRGVETPLSTVLFSQSFGYPEDAAQRCDILAEYQDLFVGGHRIVQRLGDGLRQGEVNKLVLGSGSSSPGIDDRSMI